MKQSRALVCVVLADWFVRNEMQHTGKIQNPGLFKWLFPVTLTSMYTSLHPPLGVCIYLGQLVGPKFH